MKGILAAAFLALSGLPASAADLPPLNSPATAEHFTGKFIWGDLFTGDPAAAEKFYTGLFGWTAQTIERTSKSGARPYVVLSVGDRPIAGIDRLPTRMKGEPHGRWIGYVSVPDVAAALAKAQQNGGKAVSRAKSIPARGSQGILADPEGANLGLMHSDSGDPGEYLPDIGDWTWAELFTRDGAAAARFYGSIAGYGTVQEVGQQGAPSLILTSGGFSRAAVLAERAGPKARSAWLLFVRVASVKDAAAQAVKLGGRVVLAPSDSPSAYWRAVVADPTGAHIGLVELGSDETGGADR